MQSGLRMSIGAQPDEVAKVQAAVADFAASQGLPDAIRRSMQVVVDELFANIVSHGLAARDGGEATIEVTRSAAGLTLTVSDNGPPFDPFGHEAPDTTLPVEARPIGGLGLHLVRKMMDEVSYHRRDDRNVMVLTKRLPADTTSSHPEGE